MDIREAAAAAVPPQPFTPLVPGTIVTTEGHWPNVGIVLRYRRTQTNVALTWFEDIYEVHWLQWDTNQQNVVREHGITRKT